MKTVSAMLALTLLTGSLELFADTLHIEEKHDAEQPSYRYGMHLHIKTGLSRQALSTDGGLLPMVMTYMDSTNEVQQPRYKDYSPCPGELSQ